MLTLHQIYKVKNNKIVVYLPEDFSAEEVEVIILPVSEAGKQSAEVDIENNELTAVLDRFLKLDTAHFTDEQRQAYERTCQLLQHGRVSGEPRIAGLFSGLVQITDDFDAPLPDETLFWGANSDEYGLLNAK